MTLLPGTPSCVPYLGVQLISCARCVQIIAVVRDGALRTIGGALLCGTIDNYDEPDMYVVCSCCGDGVKIETS